VKNKSTILTEKIVTMDDVVVAQRRRNYEICVYENNFCNV